MRGSAKTEIMEEVVTKAMKTVIEGFKESEILLELEEKQMLFKERMRHKDREFHMEMMKMFAGRLPPQNPAGYNMYQSPPQPGYFNPSDAL